MKVEKIFIYPIKGVQGVTVPSARLTEHGFPYDRRFMLWRDNGKDASKRYDKMQVDTFTKLALFKTALSNASPNSENHNDASDAKIIVTYTDPETKDEKQIDVPLRPDVSRLEFFDTDLHGSRTEAHLMPEKYSRFFSDAFGFEVRLVYLHAPTRTVLGNLAPDAQARNQRKKAAMQAQQGYMSSALSSLTSSVSSFWGGASSNGRENQDPDYTIGFADVSPYMIISETSVQNVTSRLAEGEKMDERRFRPNIIVSGASEAFEEDYWGELTLENSGVKLALTANCLRCMSINVDYSTGKLALGEQGRVLKKLSVDRRIDPGSKYSPAFGRYAFLERGQEQTAIKVGDSISVSKTNQERTVFRWPGLGSTAKDDLFPVEPA